MIGLLHDLHPFVHLAGPHEVLAKFVESHAVVSSRFAVRTHRRRHRHMINAPCQLQWKSREAILIFGPVEMDAAAVVGRLGRWAFLDAMPGGVGFGRAGRASTDRCGPGRRGPCAARSGRRVGDAVEIGRPVPQLLGDEMDHDALRRCTAAPCRDAQQARAHDDAAIGFEDLGPDHEIGDAELVLQGDEHHARGGARPLAHQHQPGHAEEVAVRGPRAASSECAMPPLRQRRPQQLQRMGAQRHRDGRVVVDHLLAQRELGQADRRLEVARLRPRVEQRQRRLGEGAHRPQHVAPRQAQRGEGVGPRQRQDLALVEPAAPPQVGRIAIGRRCAARPCA